MDINERVKYNEDLILASAIRDPRLVMPVLEGMDINSKFESKEGRYLLDVFKAVQRSKGELSLVAIDAVIAQQGITGPQKEALRARLLYVHSMVITDTDYVKVANFASTEIDDINFDRTTSKKLEELGNLHKTGQGREKILEATLDFYTSLATNLNREESRSMTFGLEQLISVEKPKVLTGYSTGFDTLDVIIHGLRPGLHVVVGDTSSGKSTLLCNIGKNLALHNKKVLVINIEMSRREWQLKTLAMLSHVDEDKLVAATFSRTKEDANAVAKAIEIMKGWDKKYFYEFVPTIDPAVVRHHIINYVYRHGVDVIIFDHLKAADNDQDRYNALGNLTKTLKSLSGILQVPILTAAQGRRPDGAFKKTPTKASVADSYDIMRNSDTGWFIMDDAIFIVKNRAGKDNVIIPIRWHKPTSLMIEDKIKK